MNNYGLLLEELKKIIAIKSVKDTPKEGMPFGEGPYKALKATLLLAEKWGFDTIDYDGYLGEITAGEGEEFGIIGHVDVVPEGIGWTGDPYELREEGGYLFARGITDDKGPTVICLYALKKIIEEGRKLKRKVRFFIGTDEESGWGDVDYFLSKGNSFPKEGISPDGDFPVVYAEKGPNKIYFSIPYSGKFTSFTGGTAFNAVCAYATVNGVIDEKLLTKHGLSHEGDKIISVGKSAHGSKPHLGKNAILPILNYMADMGEPVTDIIDYLFNDKLNVSSIGNETGKATFSPNLIEQKDDKLIITVDFRVPAKMNLSDFLPVFDKFSLPYTAYKVRDPLYVSPDSALVKNLIKAYDLVTGEKAEPFSQSGATFASVFENGCAFGPEFAGEKNHIHEPDECMKVENVDKLFRIYYEALKNILI